MSSQELEILNAVASGDIVAIVKQRTYDCFYPW
jgi:hypothetical protein